MPSKCSQTSSLELRQESEAQHFDIDGSNPGRNSMDKLYSISDASERARISVHQVRKYLHAGLIGHPARNRQGHYRLDENCLRRLRIIGLATDVGLLIRELKPLLYELDRVSGLRATRMQSHLHVLEQELSDREHALDEFEQRLDRACGAYRQKPDAQMEI